MAIEESCSGDLRTTSVSPPAHYILNIQQFSLLTKQHVERYESNEFEAAGYKWNLFPEVNYQILIFTTNFDSYLFYVY
ncbi:putative MATH/TRAF domain-containing protein [Helianthus debilis subsp. tardiflorus]